MATASQQFLDTALRQFAKEFIKNRTVDIIKTGLTNEKDLLNSLKAQVLNDPERGIYMMLVAFNNYGRIQDMAKRRVSYKDAGGAEMIEWLIEWVQKKGLEKFKKGKYAKQYEGKSDTRIAYMIAWGVLKNLKKNGKRKKRGWYNTGKERDINNFYDFVLRGYKEAIVYELKQQMNDGR